MKEAVAYICVTVMVILFIGQDPLIDRIGRPPANCQAPHAAH